MPYLQLDLDAMKRVPDAARAAGVTEHELGWGLLRLWAWCWQEKRDRCSTLMLCGFFAGDGTRIGPALAEWGFLDPEDGQWRIRGAEKRLKVARAQSDAGKKNAGNLRQNAPARAGGEPELEPEGSRKSKPALTPKTQSPNHPTKEKEACVDEKPSTPAHPLVALWNEATTPPLPRAKESEGREEALKHAAKRRPAEQWREVFSRIEASNYCRGEKGWVANLDWAIRKAGQKPETALSVLEGAYDNRGPAPPKRKSNNELFQPYEPEDPNRAAS